MNEQIALAGARIVVTRPAGQAQGLCDAIAARGGVALPLPLIGIEPLNNRAELSARLREALDARWWVFTSSNAVRFAANLLPPPWPAALATVGPATAAALARLGCQAAVMPATGASSEALLELPAFIAESGDRVLIVTGEEGRDTLAQTLVARGVQVETLAVYRRVALTPAARIVAPLIEAADAIVVTSAQSLDQLIAVTPASHQARLRATPLALPSPRVVEHAMSTGFLNPPLVPSTVSDAAFAEVLAHWWPTALRK